MEDPTKRGPDPLQTIWLSPRTTIRRILDKDPKELVLILAMVGGVTMYVSSAATKSLGVYMSLSNIAWLSFILGSIIGVISLYITTLLLRWTGSWIGGKGTFAEIRAAFAWSRVPLAVVLLIWIILVYVHGRQVFISSALWVEPNARLLYDLDGFKVLRIIFKLWTFVLLIVCISEVQKFSIWKSLVNILLAAAVVFIPILGLAVYFLGFSFITASF